MATTATYFDIQLIVQDATFKNRVQAAVYRYAIVTVGGASDLTLVNHNIRKNYATIVLNNFAAYAAGWEWAVAQNATLANDVLNLGNAGVNFTRTTPLTGASSVQSAIDAIPDSDYDSIVATAWNIMANA